MRKTSMKTMTFMIAIWMVFLLLLAHDVYKNVIAISTPTNGTLKTIEDFMGRTYCD